MSENVLPMFSSRSFMVSCHIFGASLVAQMVKNLQCRRPRFNLWVWTISWRREWCLLSFMYGVRDCSDFLDLYASVQLFQHHTEETFFPLNSVLMPPLSRVYSSCKVSSDFLFDSIIDSIFFF